MHPPNEGITMRRNQTNTGRQRAIKITHGTIAIVAGLSLIAGGGAGAALAYVHGTGGAMSATAQSATGQPGGAGGADTMSFDYSGSYTAALTADGESESSEGETHTATDSDQNAALVQNGGTLTLANALLQKSGDDTDGDRCNFYGVNSILTAVGEGSTAYVSDSSLAATSAGSNGVFATDNACAYVSNTSIDTTADNSRGLDATYGGTIIADKVDITTAGNHSGGIATDRGGGNISVTDSGVSTQGSGSPILYSTGDIEVEGLTGTASGSQIAGMEGLNTILIKNSTLTSTQTGKTASDPIADGIIIYQSTSGDAESTTGDAATFQAVDSTLSSAIESGSMFYLTNTNAEIVLKNTELVFDSSKAALLTAAGNDSNNWGQAGSNGATVTFTGIDQTLKGDIAADTISTVNVFLTKKTTWTGAASITENANGSTSEAPITVNVDKTSTWVVTESCTVSNLNVADGGKVIDANGKTVTVVADGKTVVEGTSDITVTVEGTYSTSVTTSNANKLASKTIDRSEFDDKYGTSTAFTLKD